MNVTKVLPIDGLPGKTLVKNNRNLCRIGGYFFALLLLPIVYPSPKQVTAKPITAMRPSIVIVGIPSSYVIGGTLPSVESKPSTISVAPYGILP